MLRVVRNAKRLFSMGPAATYLNKSHTYPLPAGEDLLFRKQSSVPSAKDEW